MEYILDAEVRMVLRRISLGLAVCGLATGCDRLYPSKLVIRNAGTDTVRSVTVSSTDGHRWLLGNLSPGDATTFSASIPGEGGLEVSYLFAGKHITASGGCYYTSGWMNPADGDVIIANERAKIDCRSG